MLALDQPTQSALKHLQFISYYKAQHLLSAHKATSRYIARLYPACSNSQHNTLCQPSTSCACNGFYTARGQSISSSLSTACLPHAKKLNQTCISTSNITHTAAVVNRVIMFQQVLIAIPPRHFMVLLKASHPLSLRISRDSQQPAMGQLVGLQPAESC